MNKQWKVALFALDVEDKSTEFGEITVVCEDTLPGQSDVEYDVHDRVLGVLASMTKTIFQANPGMSTLCVKTVGEPVYTDRPITGDVEVLQQCSELLLHGTH